MLRVHFFQFHHDEDAAGSRCPHALRSLNLKLKNVLYYLDG